MVRALFVKQAALIFAIAGFRWLPSLNAAETCLRYEPAGVEVSGKVVLRTFFGPPNYGENPGTDTRETQGLLELDSAICTTSSGSKDPNAEDERDQRVVTLIPTLSGLDLAAYAGERVRVKGSLSHAQTGHHRTPLLMTVAKITRLGSDGKAADK
jgi:hypothetical protein